MTMEARGQLERERQQAGGSGKGVEREGGDGREDCDCSKRVRSYAYMQNLKKMIQMKLFAKQKQTHRLRE